MDFNRVYGRILKRNFFDRASSQSNLQVCARSFFGPSLIAMALVDEISSVGGYLQEASKFPSSFEATKVRQLNLLIDFAKKDRWNPAQATDGIRVLLSQSCWSEEEKNRLVEAIQCGMSAENTTDRLGGTNGIRYQDFTSLLFYLPQQVWEALFDDKESDVHKVMKLSEIAMRLGLRMASETTWAAWIALLYQMPGCKFGGQSSHEMHAAYVLTKQ